MNEITKTVLENLPKQTFIDCCVLSHDYFGILGVTEDDRDLWESTPPVTLSTMIFEGMNDIGNWGYSEFESDQWTFPMVAHTKDNECIWVDRRGNVFYLGLGSNKQAENAIEIDGRMTTYSNIEGLKNIHGTIYVVGNFRTVIRREGINQWVRVSDDSMEYDALQHYREGEKTGNRFKSGFECIDGFAADDYLYAAGNGSDVWRYEKKLGHWLPVDIGQSNIYFKTICCAGDGLVYIGGWHRTLVCGLKDQWQFINTDHLLDYEDIYDLAWFNNCLYAATQRRLYQLKEERLVPVDYGLPNGLMPSGAGHLYTNAGWLMSVGNYSAAIYNGEQWKILYGVSETDNETARLLAGYIVGQAIETLHDIESKI